MVAAAHNEHPLTRSYPAAFAPPLLSVDKRLFADPLEFAYQPAASRSSFRRTAAATWGRSPPSRRRAGPRRTWPASPPASCRCGRA